MQNTVAKDTLREYVKRNEVIFQAFGNLVEVAMRLRNFVKDRIQ